mgnify:FL=1|jgi:hypothetical protein|tara:strand:+ start:16799 stop:17662 length:864 start_codon:yes stop_codon:yes gene_type:complete
MKVDFFIVGAPKSGTTSLYHYLNQHQDICMSLIKEPNYFSSEELNDQGLYYKAKVISKLESYHKIFIQEKDHQLLGEASVSYLFYQNVPLKIYKYNPTAKIIILLRNPIERAHSHYLMDYRLGHTKISLDAILNDSSVKDHALLYQQYIELGFYYNQVKRYVDVFGHDNVCVMLYDQLKENNEELTNNIIRFLNVDLNHGINFKTPYNRSKSSTNKIIQKLYSLTFIRKSVSFLFPNSIISYINKIFFNNKENSLSTRLEDKLYNLYSEDILLLEKMLKIDLSSWKR